MSGEHTDLVFVDAKGTEILKYGKATVIDKLTIRWPDKAHTVQSFEQVPVDRFLVVREGAKRWTEAKAR